MSTQVRAPTSDVDVTGTWTGSAGTRYTVVDDYPDLVGADQLTVSNLGAGYVTFGFTAFAIQAGSTINSITVRYVDEKVNSLIANARSALKIGGVYFFSGYHTPATNTWTARADTYTTNPATGLAWTVAQVNGTDPTNPLTAFGFSSTDAHSSVQVSSVQIEVDYTPPPVTGTISQTLAGVTPSVTGLVTNLGPFASTLAGAQALFSGAASLAGFRSLLWMEAGGAGNIPTLTSTLSATLAGAAAAFTGGVRDVGSFASTLGGVTPTFVGFVSGAASAGYRSFFWHEAGGAADAHPSGSFASTLTGVTPTISGSITAGFRSILWLEGGGASSQYQSGAIATALTGASMSAAGVVGGSGGVFGGYRSILWMEAGGASAVPLEAYRLKPFEEGTPLGWFSDPGYAVYYKHEQIGIPVASRDQVAAVTGDLGATLGVTADFSGLVIEPITGTIAATLGGATLAAAGVGQNPDGDLTVTLEGADLDIVGKVTVLGPLAPQLAGAAMAASGLVIQNAAGTFASTLAGASLAAAGAAAPNVTGTFASTLAGARMHFQDKRRRRVSPQPRGRQPEDLEEEEMALLALLILEFTECLET